MFKKLFPLALIAVLISGAGMKLAYADSKEEEQVRFTEKVKADVMKLGTGEDARVKVQMRDQRKLEGYISATDGEGFTVTNAKTGAATHVAYPQVKIVKGNNLSTGVKVAIGVGIAIVALLLIFKDRIDGY